MTLTFEDDGAVTLFDSDAVTIAARPVDCPIEDDLLSPYAYQSSVFCFGPYTEQEDLYIGACHALAEAGFALIEDQINVVGNAPQLNFRHKAGCYCECSPGLITSTRIFVNGQDRRQHMDLFIHVKDR